MEKNFLGEFTFTNKKVLTGIETIIDKYDGKPISQLVIKSDSQYNIRMGYTSGDGLKVIDSHYRKNNPLGEFLGIDATNLDSIKIFIEKYGFIYPIADTKYEIVDITEFSLIQERLQAFINLINNQSEFHISVNELLDSVLYLMLKSYKEYDLSDKNLLLKNSSELLETISTPVVLSINHNGLKTDYINGQKILYFSRKSISLEQDVRMDFQDIQNIESNYSVPSWHKNLIKIFYSLDNLDISEITKLKIDFLFSCIQLLGYFDTYIQNQNTFSSEIYDTVKDNGPFITSLLKISKILIKEEFEQSLKDIKFTYNTETMSPDWTLPTLIGALYFSIYYKNSTNIIYRVCKNINCNQYYQVSSTNSTKKYCCDNCRDNSNARKLRARKKQG
ncbi:hypothetical protein [Streptococcus canis]|uniref:hypothetical protein n=1 Tax=Streptococcus canis TaxID=1329 RepID=UPI003B671D6D